MNEDEVKALFLLAGIEVQKLFELPNKYWPDVPDYAEIRKQSPWWLVKTPRGLIEIGWRKRVISIDWSDTTVRQVITQDDVTKDDTGVHAYSYAKAVQYLTDLRRKLNEAVAAS